MNVKQVMAELEALGTAQNRKVYARHGAAEPMFGVSFANLDKLKKRIKTDHKLAEALWATGNTDARMLACQIADPEAMKPADLDRWLKDIAYYALVDVFVRHVAARGPHAARKAGPWSKAANDWKGQAGWDLYAHLAMQGESLSEAEGEALLERIESGIHNAKNRTRHAMNGALIAIGLRSPKLQKQAISAAKRIGKVEVDHGETGCKTPDAEAYILKSAAYRERQQAKREAKTSGAKKRAKRRSARAAASP